MSLGVAEARADDDAESLIRRAGQAMYAAKRAGRNCVRMQHDIGMASRKTNA